MKKIYSAVALFVLLSGVAQASELVFDKEHLSANQVDYFNFNVASGNTDIVNTYTASGAPFDPYLTLWSTTAANPTAADWQKLAANDNTATLNFNETNNAKDGQLKLMLNPGLYLATVSSLGNVPIGTLLSEGFTNNGTQGSTFPYQLVVNGNVSAVPLPAAVWLFGTGLMGFLGISKRKGQKV